MVHGSLWRALAVVLALGFKGSALAAEPPRRVVSMNICTDQLAMLVAGPGQLHSVSFLASDPESSVLVTEAARYVSNHGLAEEIFLMRPDLVLAGTYTTRATVDLLRRLGIRVEEFAPESSFDDIRANLERMGEVLGRKQRATELVDEFDRGLAGLQVSKAGIRVANYDPNSFTAGAGTLTDAVITASGLTNIAAEFGFSGAARLPLELLIVAQPDLLAQDDTHYAAPALAQDIFLHPAYRTLAKQRASAIVPASYTTCGAPFTLEAARILSNAARALEGGPAE
ncbi:ABC transporter substrate-binding protein [Arvimicrobium flavum]|uniref:ABC transporter substrate-binding protein n=1 Tax=Arvimicrobium flavum TaxID=3393320 RepID=UPI00237B7F0B|nr:ABC transporter substrate-binding protein [Mesorhizobium shangrilense]